MKTSSDFQQHLANLMKWHFSPHTGSPFWLEMRKQLNFDPLKDIRSFSDLRFFPDISLLLRDINVDDLKPRGLRDKKIAGVFESGGTTGAAKRVIVYEAWLDQLTNWRLQTLKELPRSKQPNTLAIIPTGPHLVGAINRRRAHTLGGQCFTVDLDSRWVKKLIQAGEHAQVRSYSEHLIDQAEPIFKSQAITHLIATPPLLEAIARRPILVDHLNKNLEMILWGGTSMDIDTLDYLKRYVFPNLTITASYGSTMILSDTKARLNEDYKGLPIFDSFAPYVLIEVVDPTNKTPVPYHHRGQVIMNHLSQYALFPNILERDTAIRLPSLSKHPGAAVCGVKPLATVSGQTVIEGVY